MTDAKSDQRMEQPSKIKNVDFRAGTQKKFNWSPVTMGRLAIGVPAREIVCDESGGGARDRP
jgi:hypothetical protein